MVTTSVYQPLEPGQIRLLKLSRNVLGKLRCTLFVFDSETAPTYYAVSYCWGTDRDKVEIKCNYGSLRITRSLEGALHYFQNFSEKSKRLGHLLFLSDRYFWIDQLCINQDDKSERGHQVAMMRDIYQRASRVLIWLGPDNKHTPSALKLIKKTTPSFPDIGERTQYLTDQQFEDRGLPLPWTETWAPVAEILNRPWFSRRWIMQETVVNAQDPIVVIGKCTCDWYTLSRHIEWGRQQKINGYNSAAMESAQSIASLARNARHFNNGGPLRLWRLSSLVHEGPGMQCSDPRDHVYAMLGLTQDLDIVPDYGVDPEYLYAKVTRAAILQEATLSILDSAGSGTWLKPHARPSWSAYLDMEPDEYAGSMVELQGLLNLDSTGAVRKERHKARNASRDRPSIVSTSANDNELRLTGLHVDTIAWVSDATTANTNTEEYYATMVIPEIWEACLAYLNIPMIVTDPRVHAFARSFYTLMTCGHGRQYDDADTAPICHFWSWLHERAAYYSIDTVWLDSYVKDVLGKGGFSFQVQDYLVGRRVFITKRGYLGLSTRCPQLRPGNEVYVLFGGEVLYILEQKDAGHELLSRAYIHEFMQGEALDMLEKGVLEEEVVTLI